MDLVRNVPELASLPWIPRDERNPTASLRDPGGKGRLSCSGLGNAFATKRER